MEIKFQILKKSNKSQARLGILKTSHGEVETPCFAPVATQAVVKTLTSEEVLQTKSQILIANTFHLHLKPGENVVERAGGLHKFMNWQRPLMTDSGGFQVFSLGFGHDLKINKVLKKRIKNKVKEGDAPKNIRIAENGVFFNSPIDGKNVFLGPRESIKIQEKLGADIIFAFDECPAPNASYEYVKKSLERTHRWAIDCLKTKNYKLKNQSLFGIVQGGRFKDLRIKSAKFIGSLNFDGFGIGGEFGESKNQMEKMLRWTFAELPENKPRHLLGIGYLEDIPRIIKAGVDTFDCIVPTHYARRGFAFTSVGELNMNKSFFLKDRQLLDRKCSCFVCQNYTRAYICHLIKAKEITGLKLLTFHNLYSFNSYIEKIRKAIKDNKF